MRERRRLRVTGVVQGVGFRPFLYALACELNLTGLVGNDSSGVFLEVQGEPDALNAFQIRLREQAPPLARIEAVSCATMPIREEQEFQIVASEEVVGASTAVSPDVSICADCLRELFDPADRRYRYPFLNCTNCGPRFTIIGDLPYDRSRTTMARFQMCAECEREYHDPSSRRFHAQPNACPRCGPTLRYVTPEGRTQAVAENALKRAVQRLARGAIVAIKGVGGFHLACEASCEEAVGLLRERKGRGEKPFAVMMADLDMVRRYALVEDAEARLLTGKERPIVLLRRAAGAGVLSRQVAPGSTTLGVMLPYSPLHYLLVTDQPLVMTSGNRSEEPIVRDEEEALQRLGGLADGFLVHDRPIHVVCDDSVVRVLEGREYPIRRSRGYAPLPVKLPGAGRSVLAVGGELKATFCLTKEEHAYLSQHLGDMENLETLQALERALEHMAALFRVNPEVVVCDLHPGYLSSRWAAEHARRKGLELVVVQHHHAHVASLLTEREVALSHPVLVFVFDGTGLGLDGAIWGGEVFVTGVQGIVRVAHLKYVPLPGGDASIRRPYRTACAHLWAAGVEWANELPCVEACPEVERRLLRRQLETGSGCVWTSSMGRLFDALAAILGVRQTVSYEAQAALELEALAEGEENGWYEWDLREGEAIEIDPGRLLRAVVEERQRGVAVSVLARRCHQAVAELIVTVAKRVRDRGGPDTVGLTGGVFQNALLVRLATDRLREAGFEVWTHRIVPANDGGLCLGQAVLGQGGYSTS